MHLLLVQRFICYLFFVCETLEKNYPAYLDKSTVYNIGKEGEKVGCKLTMSSITGQHNDQKKKDKQRSTIM